MKKTVLTWMLAISFISGATLLSSCGSDNDNDDATENTDQNAADDGEDEMQNNDSDTVAAVYICPMHSDEVSNEPGKCSQCGMDLVKQESDASDATSCTCPKCNKDMAQAGSDMKCKDMSGCKDKSAGCCKKGDQCTKKKDKCCVSSSES